MALRDEITCSLQGASVRWSSRKFGGGSHYDSPMRAGWIVRATEMIDNPILNSPHEQPDRYYGIEPSGA
jgi:hypothetical protein